MSEQEVAPTTNGKLRGVRIGGTHALKGIHYGAPTGGATRFRQPPPVDPWSGVKDALAYGARAAMRRLVSLALARRSRHIFRYVMVSIFPILSKIMRHSSKIVSAV